MTSNQPPRKRTTMEISTDVETGELTAVEANEEIETNAESTES